MELTSQKYWQKVWDGQAQHTDFVHYQDVAKHLPHIAGLSFCEIGCSPGGILEKFCGTLKYEAHGIDYAGEPDEVARYLGERGITVGQIHKGDFFSWQPGRQYDVVASFGFVEHFDDITGVVQKHFELVKPGGYVVITMPNFAKGQKLLHWLWDRENLTRHNTAAMNPGLIQRIAQSNGAATLTAGYTGGQFEFWTEAVNPSWLAQRLMWRTVGALRAWAKRRPPGANCWLSPYIVTVFRAAE